MGLLPKCWAVAIPLPLMNCWKEIMTPIGDQMQVPANLIVNISNEGLVVRKREEHSSMSVLCVSRAAEARVP